MPVREQIRHLGTEKAQELYLALENDLRAKGVDMLFGHSCVDLVLDGPLCKGVIVEPTRGGTRETIYADAFNGKARFNMEFPADETSEAIQSTVLADERSAKWMEGKSVVKVIVVPKKIVNIVIK